MAQTGLVIAVRTDKDTHFTGALAQNAKAVENIDLAYSISANPGSRFILRAINVISDQNLAWEVWLWADNIFDTTNTDIDTCKVRGRWKWDTTDAVTIAGAAPYYYYIDGLQVVYHDTQDLGQLHIMLVNRSATAKNAGATGEIVIELQVEIPTGW